MDRGAPRALEAAMPIQWTKALLLGVPHLARQLARLEGVIGRAADPADARGGP
jgi:hypothetical protein